MKSKTSDILCSFCVSCGGLTLALLYRVDALTMLFVLTLSVAFSLFCCALSNRFASKPWVKKFFALGMLISAAVSICSGTRLVCNFSLGNSFIPICIFLGCVCALCVALSTLRSVKSVVSVMSVVCIILLIIIIVLCAFECDFSKVISGNADKWIIFPLAVFGVVDAIFIMPFIRKTNRCMFVLGSAIMPSYLLLTVLFTLSTLSKDVYYSLDNPIITLWQSCYVASFIDRFETVVLCALYIICVLKSGMLLKCSFKIFKNKRLPFIFILFSLLTVPLILKPVVIYVYATLAFISATVYVINLLLKKRY